MRGAPWQGLFYGFVLEAMITLGAFVFALQVDDFLERTIAWAVFALVGLAGLRTLRRALRQGEDRSRPTGRWWFGG